MRVISQHSAAPRYHREIDIQGEGHFSAGFWQVTEDLHAIGLTLHPSRSLILDTRLCFSDEGLNNTATWLEQTLLGYTNGTLNGKLQLIE